MKAPDTVDVTNRNRGRREEDRQLLEQISQLRQISRVGQAIMSEMNLEDLLDLIVEQTVQILDVERCTIFLYDRKANELWSKVATGIQKKKIRVPSGRGIAGWVFKNRAPLIIDDISGCVASGGSTFNVRFPLENFRASTQT